MKFLSSNKGQGVIESLLSLPLLFIAGMILTMVLYRAMIFYYADYQLHEALICTQSESVQFCEQELRARMQKILLAKNPYEVKIKKSYSNYKALVKIRFLKSVYLTSIPADIEIEKTLERSKYGS